jgi:hypothetical protein
LPFCKIERENIVLQREKVIMTMFTSASTANGLAICGLASAEPAQQDMLLRRTWKARLLILLFAILAGLLALHTLAVYIQSVALSPATCTGLIRSADYTRAVNLQSQSQEMAAVQIADNLDGGAPAALVQVTTPDPQNALDVYIFGCSIQQKKPTLIQLFTQHGLPEGTAEISPDYTLVTSNLDTHMAPANATLLQPLQQNIYREYIWQQGHFVQLPFPGFYPVASHFEAEVLQQNANQEQNSPWTDPTATALQMSRDLLHWTTNPQTRLISQNHTSAQVELTEQNPRIVLEVILKQLIQPGNAGLWFVTDAHTQGLVLTRSGTIDQPFSPSVTSPVHFSGVSALIDGQTTATLFDRTLAPIELANNIPVIVQPDSSYSGTLTYSHLASGQQGVLLIKSLPQPQNYNQESGQILLTSVILN